MINALYTFIIESHSLCYIKINNSEKPRNTVMLLATRKGWFQNSVAVTCTF